MTDHTVHSYDDGSASNGVPTFHTSSPRLADDVQFLVQSLGGTATHSVRSDHRGFRDMHVLNVALPESMPISGYREN
jgi:hypothetical protein